MTHPQLRKIFCLFSAAGGAFLFLFPNFVGAVDKPELKPEQQVEIIASKGQEVRVKGKVARVSATSSGSVNFINFEGIRFGGFSGVVHKDDITDIEKILGGTLNATLTGKEIVLEGKVTLYEGRPQIEVHDANQIEMAGKENSSSASDLLGITDTEALRKLEGKPVTLEGIVKRAGTPKGGGLVLISFEGVPSRGFMAIVMSSHLPKVEDAVGGNLDAALPGRKIRISGSISLYGEVPQIEIKTGDQIKVVP